MSHAFSVLTCFVVLLAAEACNTSASGRRVPDGAGSPNILFLMADDAGWKDFGCYGHPAIKTPNIDQLASTGLKFNNAFLTTSSCSPSRTSILSGRFAHSIGTEDMHVPLPDSVRLLPHYFKAKGYYTGHMLKTHYGPNGEKQFDWYSNKLQDFGVFLDSAGTSPFFMWIGFKDPHRPYNAKEYNAPFDPAKVAVPSWMVDDAATRRDLANYYSEIQRLDQHIGEVLTELGNRGLRENTLVIFLSDNGAPFPRAKGSLYDTGIGTPLIFNWPAKLPEKRTYDGLVSTIDLAPTVMEIAGIDVPAHLPGKSLVPVIEDRSGYTRNFAFSERNWHGADEHMRSVRDLHYKFITNGFTALPFGSPSDIVESPSWRTLKERLASDALTGEQKNLFRFPRPRRELYDIRKDAAEMKNLADDPDYVDVVERMNTALEAWQRTTADVTQDMRPKEDKTNRFTGQKVAAQN